MASNQGHGLERTNADKRRAVEVVLSLHPEWSDGRLADFVGVSQQFVSGFRPQVTTVVTSEMPAEPVKRVGKDGKEYTVPAKPAPKVEQAPAAAAEPWDEADSGAG